VGHGLRFLSGLYLSRHPFEGQEMERPQTPLPCASGQRRLLELPAAVLRMSLGNRSPRNRFRFRFRRQDDPAYSSRPGRGAAGQRGPSSRLKRMGPFRGRWPCPSSLRGKASTDAVGSAFALERGEPQRASLEEVLPRSPPRRRHEGHRFAGGGRWGLRASAKRTSVVALDRSCGVPTWIHRVSTLPFRSHRRQNRPRG
jgi:hypothetical protein